MIAIVGGGISGLAAAYRLQRAGYNPQIFEASGDVGGLATTYETAGDPIEKYYHHLLKSEQTIIEVAHELGLGDDIEWRVGKNSYYLDGVVHPFDTPWQILRFPPFSVYDVYKLGMLTLGADTTAFIPRLNAFNTPGEYDDVSLQDFLLEHTTETVYESFFEPLLKAKFGTERDRISAAWMIGRIQFRSERDPFRGEILGYINGGFQRLINRLVGAVGKDNITTDASVKNILVRDGAVEELAYEVNGTTTRIDTDDVIIATMPNVLETLTGYQCGIDFQGSICSVFSFDTQVTDTYWLNIADEVPFGVLIEHTNFIPSERYGGEHLVYAASYIQSFSSDLWQASDEEVESRWFTAISDMFGVDRENLNWVRTSRNPRTAPIYEQGYLNNVIPYDLSDEVAEGIYYSGMASRSQYPDRSLSGGIEAGFAAADALVGRRE